MDIGMARGLITLVLLIAFVALVVWLFVFRRRSDFDPAARIPLDENRTEDNGGRHE